MNPWLQFIISTVLIIFAGIRLTIYADYLSDKLQLGKVWIGVCLLGLVTSLPEAITSLVLIISLQAVDLAIGNLLGSNNFNPMLIVVMDVMYRRGSITNAMTPDRSHKTSARYAILLICIVILDVLFNMPILTLPTGILSAGSLVIAVCYFAGIHQLAQLSSGQTVISPGEQEASIDQMAAWKIWSQLLLNAALVVVGAIWLARSADVIAVQTGLGGTFFGSIFLALVTSLPEMVVSLSALKLGSLDLAVGNIFGSNMTNVFIVFICGLFHKGQPVLGAASNAHIVTASLSILLTYVAISGIYTRNKKTFFGLGTDSLIMIILFVIGTAILYQIRLF